LTTNLISQKKNFLKVTTRGVLDGRSEREGIDNMRVRNTSYLFTETEGVVSKDRQLGG